MDYSSLGYTSYAILISGKKKNQENINKIVISPVFLLPINGQGLKKFLS